MSIMQQTRLSWLWAWLNRSYDSSKMRQSSEKTSISFEHLGYSWSNHLSCHRFAPVSSSQSVSKSHRYRSWVKNELYIFLELEFSRVEFSSYDFFGVLNVAVSELIFKKIDHEYSGHIKSLFPIMISVIFISFPQKSIEQSPRHISNKIRLSTKAINICSNMRQNLLHKHRFRKLSQTFLIVDAFDTISMLTYEC